MKYCRYCGKPIDDDSTFCTHCGKSQSTQNSTVLFEQTGGVASRVWEQIMNLKGKFVMPKEGSDSTFVHIKKWIKHIVVVMIVATIIGLLVLLGFWLFGLYQTSKWTKEDERREIIAMNDISKADSIARVLFQEYEDCIHLYDFDRSQCSYSHIEKGIEILRNAAEKGNADAQYTLGCIYVGARYDHTGKSWRNRTIMDTELDHERAAYWFDLSAKQGHKIALYNLGIAYKNGYGVNEDLVKATEYIRKSAEMGEASAQLNYGDMFRDGDVWYRTEPDSINGESFLIKEKNIEKAKKWWKKALKNGNNSAKERLEKIY